MNLIKNHKIGLKIYQNIYLSNYSTIKIGGKARFFAKPQNLEQFDFAIKFCNSHGLKPFIFGSGANILFSEKIKDDIFFISLQNFNDFEIDEEKIIVSAGFPVSLLPFSGLDDLYFLYLLPGTIGAATYMNVKYDRFELGSFISKILYIDLSDNEIREIEQKDSQFSYKHSIFQEKNNWIILKIYFDKLKRDRFQLNNNIPYIEIEKFELNKLKFLLNRSRKKYSDLNKFYKFFSIKNIFNLLKYKKYLQSELQNIIFQCFSLNDEILLKMKSIEEYRLSKNHFKYQSLGSIF
ncbi:MAG: FAD-binding protein, partial [Exilispira sp.]